MVREAGGTDVILDVIGGSALADNLAMLGEGGRLEIIGTLGSAAGELPIGQLMRKRARVIGSTLRSRPLETKASILEATRYLVWPLLASGALQIPIHERLPLADASHAHEILRTGGHLGKVILKVEAAADGSRRGPGWEASSGAGGLPPVRGHGGRPLQVHRVHTAWGDVPIESRRASREHLAMTFWGADTEELRQQSDQISHASGRIEEMLASLGGLVHALHWEGPDADQFRSGFDDAYRRGLQASDQMAQYGTSLEQEARAQDDASDPVTAASELGNSLAEKISSIFDGGNGASSWGPKDLLDIGVDVTRFAGNTIRDITERMLGIDGAPSSTMAKKFMKYAPFVGAVPELNEMVQHLKEGETGLAIGDGFEAVWGVAPHPVAEAGSFVNDLSSGPGENDTSLFEKWGQIQEESFGTKLGEMQGNAVSNMLGLENGGTADNVVTSGYGVAGWTAATAFAPTSFLNQASGVWNSTRG